MAINVVVENERILGKYRELSIFTLADIHTKFSVLFNSRSKKKISGTRLRSMETGRVRTRDICKPWQ